MTPSNPNLRRPRRVYNVILDFAKTRILFRPSDVPMPRSQATWNCRRLAEIGLLKLIKKGSAPNRQPVYIIKDEVDLASQSPIH